MPGGLKAQDRRRRPPSPGKGSPDKPRGSTFPKGDPRFLAVRPRPLGEKSSPGKGALPALPGLEGVRPRLRHESARGLAEAVKDPL
jgi:hypothetical protein